MDNFEFNSLKRLEDKNSIHHIGRLMLILATFFVLTMFLPWRQTVQGEGQVIASNPEERPQFISAPIDGFIETLHTAENQKVHKGDTLFEMRDRDRDFGERMLKMKEEYEKQKDNAKSEIKNLEESVSGLKRQREIKAELFDKEKRQYEEGLKAIKYKQAGENKNMDTLLKNLVRTKNLHSSSIESKRAYEAAQNAYINAKTKFEKTTIEADMQQRKISINESEKRQYLEEMGNRIRNKENALLSARTRLSSAERENQKLLNEISRYKRAKVSLEKDGTVMRILENTKNTYIKKGTPIIHFSPEVTERTILLKISDFNMPLMKKGLKARVRFHGWPVLQISGWPCIQLGTFGGIVEKTDPVLHEKNAYYVYIKEDPNEPWPSAEELKNGTNATAWVALSNVPIWYELWRIMNAFPANMASTEREQ